MSTIIKCTTDHAVLLAGCTDSKGILRFYSEDQAYPGIHITVDSNIAVHDLLEKVLLEKVSKKVTKFELNHSYTTKLETPKGEATLFTGKFFLPDMEKVDLQSLPEILRAMPKTKTRVAYLRIWQAISGGLTDNIKAVENASLNDVLD